jgi:hypothetical protein
MCSCSSPPRSGGALSRRRRWQRSIAPAPPLLGSPSWRPASWWFATTRRRPMPSWPTSPPPRSPWSAGRGGTGCGAAERPAAADGSSRPGRGSAGAHLPAATEPEPPGSRNVAGPYRVQAATRAWQHQRMALGNSQRLALGAVNGAGRTWGSIEPADARSTRRAPRWSWGGRPLPRAGPRRSESQGPSGRSSPAPRRRTTGRRRRRDGWSRWRARRRVGARRPPSRPARPGRSSGTRSRPGPGRTAHSAAASPRTRP